MYFPSYTYSKFPKVRGRALIIIASIYWTLTASHGTKSVFGLPSASLKPPLSGAYSEILILRMRKLRNDQMKKGKG